MLKPLSYLADSHSSYQQALDDFGITELLEKLSSYSDADFDAAGAHLEPAEVETLAALLIGKLTTNLTGKPIAGYLNQLRNGLPTAIFDLSFLEFTHLPQPITLPEGFPQQTKSPRYWVGDRLRWKPLNDNQQSDFGIAIGRFYAYDRRQASWAWKYLIWLDSDSPSSCIADTAWELDLEPTEEARS